MMTFVVTLRGRDWGRQKELDKLQNGEHGKFPYVAEVSMVAWWEFTKAFTKL